MIRLNLAMDSAEETSELGNRDGASPCRGPKKGSQSLVEKAKEDEEDEEEEEEEDIDLEDLEGELDSEEDADIIPRVKNTINNHSALNAAVARISFINSKTPFVVRQSVLSSKITEESEDFDVQDDLVREDTVRIIPPMH